ncbi:MAG: helix-turn-helix domain-containing protein [Candidatus Bathyarchaeia archaeon]
MCFGLSRNEAKIYAFIIKHGDWVRPEDVSKACDIHVQDVYKVLSSLEKKGLIVRAQSKPTKIMAISPEIGLKQFFSSTKHQLYEKIKIMKKSYEEIKSDLPKFSFFKSFRKRKNAKVLVLKGDKICASFTEQLIRGLKNELIIIVSEKSPVEWPIFMLDEVKDVRRRNLKIYVLLLYGSKGRKNIDILFKELFVNNKLNPHLEVRVLNLDKNIAYAVYDSKIACFPLTSLEDGIRVLATNAPELIEIALEQFRMFWNHPMARILLSNFG